MMASTLWTSQPSIVRVSIVDSEALPAMRATMSLQGVSWEGRGLTTGMGEGGKIKQWNLVGKLRRSCSKCGLWWSNE